MNENKYKELSWEILEASSYHKLKWYPVADDQDPKDAKYMILSTDPSYKNSGMYFTNPLSTWEEIYNYLVSAESFLTRTTLGSKEKWMSKEDRKKPGYRKVLRHFKKLRDDWIKENSHPQVISLREELYVTHPKRLAKGYTQVDGDEALTLCASHSWSGDFVSIK